MKARRYVMLFLLGVVLVLICSGCSKTKEKTIPVTFYYRNSGVDYGTPDGIIGSETRVFNDDLPTYSTFLNLYFEEHIQNELLVSPFPEGLTCINTYLDDGVLTVVLSDEFGQLVGVERSIATACITKTLTQFEPVTGVCLETMSSVEDGLRPAVLTDKDYVYQDMAAVDTEVAIKLYFSDANGRYLVATERKSYFNDAEQIPTYIVQELIKGPSERGQLGVMPEGTELRGVEVVDGVCTVDFSNEFLLNRPDTAALERMLILAIVNSLTELESIRSVNFLVEGRPVNQYLYMDLGISYLRDESAIGMIREGLNETDATLYVRGLSPNQVAAVPVCIRKNSQASIQALLLEQLLAFEDINGLRRTLPVGTVIQKVQMLDGVCYVDFSARFLECAGNRTEERMAIYSVVASLTSLDDVNYVRISVNGRYDGFQYFDLNMLYRPDPSWFY